MNNQILVILVEVQTSFVANSGKEAHWRKFALEGAAAWSPGTQRPSRTLPALLQNLSSRTNQYWLPFIFKCLLRRQIETLQRNGSQYSILLTHHSPSTPSQPYLASNPLCAWPRATWASIVYFLLYLIPGLSTVFYVVFTDETFQQCILYFIFCSKFPALAFVFGASIRGHILCQIIVHPVDKVQVHDSDGEYYDCGSTKNPN